MPLDFSCQKQTKEFEPVDSLFFHDCSNPCCKKLSLYTHSYFTNMYGKTTLHVNYICFFIFKDSLNFKINDFTAPFQSQGQVEGFRLRFVHPRLFSDLSISFYHYEVLVGFSPTSILKFWRTAAVCKSSER